MIAGYRWKSSIDDKTYELQWTQVGNNFVGALYHPPKPLYETESLLKYIEMCVDEINQTCPTCIIILAGDFNQLSRNEIIERTGLTLIVHQPTRGDNMLDRIYVSEPRYTSVRVVTSVVRSDHQAVLAYSDMNHCTISKVKYQRTYRPATPNLHAQFLRHISTTDINILQPAAISVQLAFDHFL